VTRDIGQWKELLHQLWELLQSPERELLNLLYKRWEAGNGVLNVLHTLRDTRIEHNVTTMDCGWCFPTQKDAHAFLTQQLIRHTVLLFDGQRPDMEYIHRLANAVRDTQHHA
jgi:hypothetical protein